MSVLQQFTGEGARPVPPPVTPPGPSPISLYLQSTEQLGDVVHSRLRSHGSLGVFTGNLLVDVARWPAEGPQVFYYSRDVVPVHTEEISICEGQLLIGHAGELWYTGWESSPQQTTRELGLTALEDTYVVEDRSTIPDFIRRNRLLEPLLEAREPLAAAFGKDAVKKLTLVEDDEGSVTLFCLILVAGGLKEAKSALNSFDENWWLGRSGRFLGKLNFDFDLV